MEASKSFYKKGIPILIEPKLLNKRGLGQVDLALKQGHQIIVAECKNHFLPLGQNQNYRLKSSLRLICQIFGLPGKILVLRPFAKSNGTA